HFSRAVMEGVAMSLLDCKKKIESLGIPHADSAAIIGGGSYSPLWRQIVADTLCVELVKKNNSDSSLGSAIMAGVTAGLFSSYEDALSKCTKEEGRTLPNEENSQVYARLYEKYKAVHDALEDVYHKYSAI
ncbi:MAG: xylulokinase, partial [Clostridia bacterium]|nr:xylulokinase [Clostridia bacterium]